MTRQTLAQVSRFAIVGLLGFVTDFGLTLTLIHNSLDPLTARLIAIAFAMLVTWRLNRAVTFGASPSSQVSEGARYFSVAITVALINYAIYAGLLVTIASFPPALAIILAVGISSALSFFGYRLFAFRTNA